MKINNFVEAKTKALDNLKNFKNQFIIPLNQIEDIEIAGDLSNKINNIYQQVDSEDFIIAMFGSFSDGKSTVIKAITGEQDIEISPVPTTDKIQEYQYKKTLKIIDTPGLFSENLEHSEKTEKYISEANLILYLVDPVNPLKQSQHKVIKWLLKDLNKVDSTIFVINKMDSVVDLEDEEEFIEVYNTKSEVVEKTLKNIGVEITRENILAIAADPYGEGLEYWENYKDEYLDLSRINKLTNKIDTFIPENRNELMLESANSVLKDCTLQLNTDLSQYVETKKDILQTEKDELEYAEDKFNDFRSDVTSANNSIKDNIEEVRKEYITKLSNVADEKDLNDFYHLYLGEDFELLGERIERIVREKTEHLITKQKNVMLDIKNTESSYDDKRNKIIEVSGILSKQLSSTINAVSVDKLRSGITLVRNFTKAPIKFKPWGIVKLAKGLKFGGVALTALMESVNSFLAANKQNKFNAEIQEMKEAVSEYFREVKKMLSYEKFVAEYFPTIKEFDENVESKKEEINKQEQINEKLEEINKNLRAFEKSFE